MADIVVSYARSTEKVSRQVDEALQALGYSVWRDDRLPAHRAYGEVIEEQVKAAGAVLVIWSAGALKSHWVRAEANAARKAGTLVQLSVDGTAPPMPFNQFQCAKLDGWTGDTDAPGWRKVVASLGQLLGAAPAPDRETPALPNKPSIAVLPFANLSGDPDQEYFADGMVVEIANALSRFKSLFVIASGSSLSLKGKGVSPQDAARQMGVRYVLEGSVRKGGDRVRISVQLIDARDGAQIWTKRFEDTLEDVFALQDRITGGVAGQIEPTVQTAETRRGLNRPTASLGSYDLYLRAWPRFLTYERDGILEALDLFNRAIALDPAFGPALALAAQCHRFINIYGWSDDPQGHRRQGLDLAQRALNGAGDDADVLAQVAAVYAYLGEDPEAATTLADRAIALNPGSSTVWFLSGFINLRAGKLDLAIEHVETALRLDPIGPHRAGLIGYMGAARFLQGRFSEAAQLLKESAQQNHGPIFQAVLAASFGQLGQSSEAQAALARYRTLNPSAISRG